MAISTPYSRLMVAALFCAIMVWSVPSAYGTATININNLDGPGEGLNDPTPYTPEGGNLATTVGQARLNAINHAARIWAGIINSNVPIEIDANFDPLGGPDPITNLVTLGLGGPLGAAYGYPPNPNAWYYYALANSLAGYDIDPTSSDIGVTYNSDVDLPLCPGMSWYYGLDGNAGTTEVDFVTVILHEICHGLGFITWVDISTGAKLLGHDDVYMQNLENHGASPADWPSMTDAQRVTASTSITNLHWVGSGVVGAAPAILTSGLGPSNHVLMYAPATIAPGSSVSHWDMTLSPDQLMEPIMMSTDHSADLELCLLDDIGWTINGDLYMRDTPSDDGTEINPDIGPMYRTQDIWVSLSATAYSGPHSNPEYGQRNYIYVRVSNNTCIAGTGNLYVYWAKASTGLNWPAQWVGYTPSPPPAGCPAGVKYADKVTGTPIPVSVPPYSDVVYQIPWDDVPNPVNFSCFGADQSHFCLLARIQTSSTSPYGMTYPEVANVDRNVRNNNNIIWKNIEVVDMLSGGSPLKGIVIRNVKNELAAVKLKFRVPGEVMDLMHIYLELQSLFYLGFPGSLELDGIVFNPQTETGLLTDSIAELGVTLEPEASFILGLKPEVVPGWEFTENIQFQIAMEQYSDDSPEPDGGMALDILVGPPIERPTIVIEKLEDVLQGHYTDIGLFIENNNLEMGGFDFLIAYDASALAFTEAKAGQLLEDCGWEYFTYRYGFQGNCGDACPSGLLRIIAIAETNNGPFHPSCYGPPDADPHELAELTFFVTNDRTYDCQYAPVYFFWDDCSDNAISSIGGDTLFIDNAIYDHEGNLIWDEMDEAQFPESSRIPFVGAPDYCINPDPDKPSAIRFIDFVNGGFDIICSDSIDLRGDINCNGIAYEIADATMLANYFIRGLAAFNGHKEASIAASDTNNDGIPLTIADLVYLIRVITGDAEAYPKPSISPPEAIVSADINHSAAAISIQSQTSLGGAYFELTHSGYEIGEPHLIGGASDMTLRYRDENGLLRVVVYSMEKDKKIPAGSEHIFAIPIAGEGTIALKAVQLSDYFGHLIGARIEPESVLPEKYELYQNYPNPFNAGTTIFYELPRASTVRIEVFNVLGQKVATLLDQQEEAGIHSVQWNGTDQSGHSVSSGIYAYRITTQAFTDERKMVLMK